MGFLIAIGIVAVIWGIRIADNLRNDREWYEGLFEDNKSQNEYNVDPLLEAYISLSALMVRRDTDAYGEKILYLNKYFAQHFPKTHYDFGRSFTESLKNPVKHRVLSKWLNRKLPNRNQRIQVLYFLAGLSTVDGSMNAKEIELLREMCHLLELSPKDFESILAMYTQKSTSSSQQTTTHDRYRARELACQILGVSNHASLDEIKKAYRRLVKLHHPDRFATETKVQQEIAEQRFIEIQKAYELLERPI